MMMKVNKRFTVAESKVVGAIRNQVLDRRVGKSNNEII